MRAFRYAAYGAAGLAALIVAAALVIPVLIDAPGLELQLEAKLSEMVQGEVAWERMQIRLLPTPRGTLYKARVDIPNTARAQAERIDVHLRLLPLLRGRPEIASLTLSKPEIRIDITPAPRAGARPLNEAPADPMESYRRAMELIRQLAPEVLVDVHEGNIDLLVAGLPPAHVRNLTLRARTGARGMNVALTAASDNFSRIGVSASVDFDDFSGEASLELTKLVSQPWLDRFLEKSPVHVAIPAARLHAAARTDGRTNIACDFDLAVPSVVMTRESERLEVPDVAIAAGVVADKSGFAVRLKSADLGGSRLADGSARYSPADKSLAGQVEFDLDLAQAMDATRRLVSDPARQSLAGIEPVAGRARGRARVNVGERGWRARAEIAKSDASIGIRGLPGPVRLASGALELARDSVKVERASVSMLDARAVASATIRFGGPLRIDGAVSEGTVGENLLDWVWKLAQLPPQLALKGPVRVAVQRVGWGAKQPLDLEATAAFEAGPGLAVTLRLSPGVLDLRRAAIKDAASDAVLSLHVQDNVLEGEFSGALRAASIDAMLKSAQLRSGSVAGRLRFAYDPRHPQRASAEGKLTAEALELSALLGRSVKVQRIELTADADALHIREVALSVAEQPVRLQGSIGRGASGLVIDAQLDSPGVLVDALLPPKNDKENAKEKESGAAAADPWPLPLTGRIALRSDFVQYGRYKAAPVAAVLTLEERKAHLDLQRAELCGIALPLTLDATPAGLAVAARFSAKQQPLEQTARCLSDQGTLISGDFDLRAELRASGKPGELLRNLQGTVKAESRNGRVTKFGLLGNIMAMQNVAALVLEGGPKLDTDAFPYRSIALAGRFDKGRFVIDESNFASDAFGLAATGWISLADYQSELAVLIAPLGVLDQVARKLPVVGYISGGALTGIPVRVTGDIRSPLVVPLGLQAIGSELLGIFERTVKLPGELLNQKAAPAPEAPPRPPAR